MMLQVCAPGIVRTPLVYCIQFFSSEHLPKCRETALCRMIMLTPTPCSFCLRGAYADSPYAILTQAYATQGFAYASLL